MQFNSILLAAADNAGMMNILFIVVLIAIFYFLMIRPQNKKQKEIRKFRRLAIGRQSDYSRWNFWKNQRSEKTPTSFLKLPIM